MSAKCHGHQSPLLTANTEAGGTIAGGRAAIALAFGTGEAGSVDAVRGCCRANLNTAKISSQLIEATSSDVFFKVKIFLRKYL